MCLTKNKICVKATNKSKQAYEGANNKTITLAISTNYKFCLTWLLRMSWLAFVKNLKSQRFLKQLLNTFINIQRYCLNHMVIFSWTFVCDTVAPATEIIKIYRRYLMKQFLLNRRDADDLWRHDTRQSSNLLHKIVVKLSLLHV